MEVRIEAGTIPARDGIARDRSLPNSLPYLEFLRGEASLSAASKPD